MGGIHLEARSASRDSYRLNVEELEEIMFALITLVLWFTQLLMPCSTPHCMRMATSTLELLKEVVRMKINVSVSQPDPTYSLPYLSKPTDLAGRQNVYSQASVPEMKSSKWHI